MTHVTLPDTGHYCGVWNLFGSPTLYYQPETFERCFDALDGRIARLTRTDSAFGAELDSLCDVITFAVAPAFFVKVLLQRADPNLFAAHPRIGLWISVLFVACAILRLARC